MFLQAVKLMSVPNQKHIIINKDPCNKENIFAIINIQALENAMIQLNGECFKLWIYFSKNQDKYNFDLSQKAAERCGIKKTSYYTHIETLIKKGYLQQKEENSNIFYFTETPFSEIRKEREEKEMIISEIRKEMSGNRTEISVIQQRNNINILQNNNTNKKSGKAANNLDEYCKDVLEEINEDYKANKFDVQQIEIIKELNEYLQQNCYTETTETLYNEILKVYDELYIY